MSASTRGISQLQVWSSEDVARTICAIHGHGIQTVITENGNKEVTLCNKCGLTLKEIRAGKKEN